MEVPPGGSPRGLSYINAHRRCAHSIISHMDIQPTDILTGDFDEWVGRGRQLIAEHEQNAWAIGDWYNEGKQKYGKRVASATALGISVSSLAAYAAVAKAVELNTRVINLPHTTHRQVMRLTDPQQKAVLAQAVEHSWTARATAEAVKEQYPPPPKRPDPLANVREHAAKQAQLNAAERAAANDRAVAAFLKRLDQIRGYFGTLTATTTQPVVIARFSAEGRDFATRRLADFQSEILALQTTLEETP